MFIKATLTSHVHLQLIQKTFSRKFKQYLERRREELQTWAILEEGITNRENELRQEKENTGTGLPRKL